MTKAYQNVQTELLSAYDSAIETNKVSQVTVSGTLVKVAPWMGQLAFYVGTHGALTLWEACAVLSNRTV
jgi:hypothetical protein